jgi:hypothetical protein
MASILISCSGHGKKQITSEKIDDCSYSEIYEKSGIKSFIQDSVVRFASDSKNNIELDRRIIHYLKQNLKESERQILCEQIKNQAEELNIPNDILQEVKSITKNFLDELRDEYDREEKLKAPIYINNRYRIDHILNDTTISLNNKLRHVFKDTISKYNSYNFSIIDEKSFMKYLGNITERELEKYIGIDELSNNSNIQSGASKIIVQKISEGNYLVHLNNHKKVELSSSNEVWGPRYTFDAYFPSLELASFTICGEGCGDYNINIRNGQIIHFIPNLSEESDNFYHFYTGDGYIDEDIISLRFGKLTKGEYVIRYENIVEFEGNRYGCTFKIEDAYWTVSNQFVFKITQTNLLTNNKEISYLKVKIKQLDYNQ